MKLVFEIKINWMLKLVVIIWHHQKKAMCEFNTIKLDNRNYLKNANLMKDLNDWKKLWF